METTSLTIVPAPFAASSKEPIWPRFASATNELRGILGGAPELLELLEEFVASSVFDEGRTRSHGELFAAQRLARSLLLFTKDYERVYAWYASFKSPQSTQDAESVRRLVESVNGCQDSFGFLKGYDSVLEIGAGSAPIGLALASQNSAWLATDIGVPDEFFAVAKVVGRPANLTYEVANAVDLLNIESNSMDVVVSRSFIEHLLLEDVHRFLTQCGRVLRSSGSIVVFCPSNVGPPSEVTRHFPEYRSVQGLHIKEWPFSDLAQALAEHGFENVRSRFLSLRGMRRIPLAVNKRNTVGLRTATMLERAARATNGMAYRGGLTAHLWSSVWGHLGAAQTAVIATWQDDLRQERVS